VLQTGGHAYHVDEPAVTRRGIVVALGRRARMPSAAVPELTFGLMIAVLRRIHPLAAELAAGAWRDLERTLTAAEANRLRDRVYAGLHTG